MAAMNPRSQRPALINIKTLSYTFLPLIIGLMLAEFGVGGEEMG